MVWAVYKRTVDGEILVRLYDKKDYADKYVARMDEHFYVRQIPVYAGEIMEG